MTHFGVKFLLWISEKKWHHIISGEILINFCFDHFLCNLNPIWEKRVWKFKFFFRFVRINQHGSFHFLIQLNSTNQSNSGSDDIQV